MTKEKLLDVIEGQMIGSPRFFDGIFYLYLTPLIIDKCGGKEKIEEIAPLFFQRTVKVVETPSVYKE